MLKKLFITGFVSLFVLQGVAEAASISSRVRVLESKVYKQDKKIKEAYSSQKQSEAKANKSLSKVQALEKKLNAMLEEQKKEQKPKTDKRYAFP